MPSIDGAFIGLARYIRDHFGALSWMPLWYGGIPFPDCYPPLLHAMVAAVSGLASIDAALAYHAVTATIYSLGPVALYWAARRIGARLLPAFLAALGYSLLSPSIWFGSEIRHDIGGWFAPTRLDAMVRWGEGPHIASLALLPVAFGLMHVALQRCRTAWYFAAALGMAAVALSNWIGGMALALMAGAYILADFGPARFPQWLRMAAIAAWAYALAAPFVTPSTIATIMANAPLVASGYKPNHLLQLSFLGGALLLAWLLSSVKLEPAVRFGAIALYLTAAITLCAYWFKLAIVPQPERYHLEMDQAFWLAIAFCANRLRVAHQRYVLAAALTLAIPIAIHQHRRAQEIEKPIAIATTVEYEISHWLGANHPGQRVFAPGTIGFWMQSFSDTPMLTGGFDNGMRNTVLQDVNYQIYAGDQQDTMLAWLKAFGVAIIIGDTPQSREFYHPYAHPEKFAGLPEIWREGADVVYSVPGSCRSLAHAMLPSDLPAVRPPAYYAKPLDAYLAALEKGCVSFEWTGTASAAIHATLTPHQILSVQIAWDQGWTAHVGGAPCAIRQDKLGQMTIEPKCTGACTIELAYNGGLEQQAARGASGLALLAGLASIIAPIIFLRKRLPA